MKKMNEMRKEAYDNNEGIKYIKEVLGIEKVDMTEAERAEGKRIVFEHAASNKEMIRRFKSEFPTMSELEIKDFLKKQGEEG